MDSSKRQRTTGPSPPLTLSLPSVIKIGGGARLELPSVLTAMGVKRPMIVTDAFVAKSGMLDDVYAALAAAALPVVTFSGAVPDPTTDSLAAGLAAWKAAAEEERCDCMVGVGGGSSIDTAKALAVLAVHGGEMRDYKVPALAPEGLPIVAVPTTAGTGSEATKFTIISDTATQEKMLIAGIGLMPRAAVVDFELTLTMPYRLTADSALDSLCHAMEAYVSKKANGFSDVHALAAMRAIPANLRAVCADLTNRDAREALMAAATHAGIAFSNSSVTLIHGMSRPIGAFFHVPHGLSNAMLLPIVTEFSLPGAPTRYAECSRAMGFASPADNDAVAGAKLIEGLSELCAALRVPSPAAHGIDEAKYTDAVQTMAAQALASGSPGNNPVVPTKEQIVTLYKRVFRGEVADAA